MRREPMYRSFGSTTTMGSSSTRPPQSFAVGGDATMATHASPLSPRERALLDVGRRLAMEVGTIVGLAYLEVATAGTATPVALPRIILSTAMIYALVHRVQELTVVAIVAEADIPKITRAYDQVGLAGRATSTALYVVGEVTGWIKPSQPSFEPLGKFIDSVTSFTEALSDYQTQPQSATRLWGVMTEAKNLVERWHDYSASLVEGASYEGNTLGLRLLDDDPLAKYRNLEYSVLDGPRAVGSADESDGFKRRDVP